MALTKADRRSRIKYRIRKKISGTAETPRLAIFRSNKEIYAQLIDDVAGKTLLGGASLKKGDKSKGAKVAKASDMGKAFAEKAIAAGFSSVVFDRSGYLYHGRVKSFAEAAREAGLKF